MKHKLILFFAALAILAQACTSAAAQPTQTAITATQRPPLTPAPTPAPMPLCGTPVSAEADTEVTGTLAKFEPPDGYAYFGFTYRLWGDGMPLADAQSWGDTRNFSERICDSVEFELSGKTPTIIKVQAPWQAADGTTLPFSSLFGQIEQIRVALGPSVIPLVEWQAQTDTPGGGVEVGYSGLTTRDIAAGDLDDYIRQYARDIKAYGQPLFIRLICGEFNLASWQWCSPRANSALTSADFVSAWQRVVDIFQEEGVTNVAWVWTPGVPVPQSLGDWGHDPNWQSYYPGDEYVDWVGGDYYDAGDQYLSPAAWLDEVVQFAVDRDKPFFLAEFGIRHEASPRHTPAEWMNWLTELFDYIESHPQIKAVLYFNYKGDNRPASSTVIYEYNRQVTYAENVNDMDHRILAGGPDFRALFLERIANSRYISVLWNPCVNVIAPAACTAP